MLAAAKAELADLRAKLAEVEGELTSHRKDLEDAAGEFLVDIPHPESVTAKLLRANSIMRRQRDEYWHRATAAESAKEAAERRLEELEAAAKELYTSGRWQCCVLSQDEQAKLWERLRDAIGLAPGTATAAGIGITPPAGEGMEGT